MDLILYNGKIVTIDKKNREAQAVAVQGDMIIKVGSNEEIMKLRKNNTKVINLQGKLVVPGFTDSHMHLIGYGTSIQKVDLKDCKSVEDIIDKVKKFIKVKNIPAGKWVQGINWNQENFDVKRFPNKYDLNKISKVHPICITRACYHVSIINDKALEVLGIDKDSIQIQSGEIDTDKKGNVLGIFRENSMWIIDDAIAEPNLEELKDIIRNACCNASKQGITSIHTDDFAYLPSKNYEKIIKAYKQLENEGKLKVRINAQCRLSNMEILQEFIDKKYNKFKGDKFFKFGPLKLICDGSLGARTAYLSYKYNDDCSTCGICNFTQEELDEIILTAHKAGMQIAVHCIGDKAMDMVLKSIQKAVQKYPRKDTRHSIIHAQITDKLLIEKFKNMDIIANVQPIFLNADLHVVEKRIGKEKAKYTYNWKTMIDKGIHVTCGSDCPIEHFDILPNIYSAVTRKDLKGYPEGGWLKEQKLSVYEALKGFTYEGAYASFEENLKGSITENKLADMVVLSENIFEIEPDNIKNVQVLMTILGGEVVYKR